MTKFEQLGLPDTLTHGNLSWRNIAYPSVKDGTYIFFAWEDATISDPFSDPHYLLEESGLSEDEKDCDASRYLKHWIKYAALSELEASWRKVPFLDIIKEFVAEASLPKASRSSDFDRFPQLVMHHLNEADERFDTDDEC